MKKLIILLFVIGYSANVNAYSWGIYYNSTIGIGASLNTYGHTNKTYEDRYVHWNSISNFSPINLGIFSRFPSSEMSMSVSMIMPTGELFQKDINRTLRLSFEYDHLFKKPDDYGFIIGAKCYFQRSLKKDYKSSASSRFGTDGIIGIDIGDSHFIMRPFVYFGVDGGVESTTLKYGFSIGLGLRAYFIFGE